MNRDDLAAVAAWSRDRSSALDGPVHIHFDELLGERYMRIAATEIARDVMAETASALADRLADVKPVVTLPLRQTARFTRRPPAIAALGSLFDNWEPPSLWLVRRDAFGKVAMLMENHEVALRCDDSADGGAVVWYYRTWRPVDGEAWSRSISVEHWLKIGPGQELPARGQGPDGTRGN